jgi:hypothetical protein
LKRILKEEKTRILDEVAEISFTVLNRNSAVDTEDFQQKSQ